MTDIDHAHHKLHQASWSLGEHCGHTKAGPQWTVDGTNGENRFQATAPTQDAAWQLALEHARTLGMVGRVF